MEEIDKLLDELILLLDNCPSIVELQKIKNNINQDTLMLINDYRINKTVDNKKKLYEDKTFRDYINCESNINYLIMEINKKFKLERGMCCESNKW